MLYFPYIKVEGNARERGKQIGVKAKSQISHNIEAYKKLFMEYARLDWNTAKTRAAEYILWIEQYDQEIMDEIKGISEGSGFDLLEIVALNARTELILNTDGCTSLAAVPPATKHNEVLLGQNWDWGDLLKPGMIILEINQDPRPKILMVTEAGIVGKIGFNSQGLGVCLNLLGTADRIMGVPVHVVLRGILNSKTLSQAVGQVGRMPRGAAANYLMAHKEGEILNVEMSPTDYDVLYPVNGAMGHANHFIGPKLVNVQDTAKIRYPDTHIRQCRVDKLLPSNVGTIDSETFKHIFSDHKGYPDSICRHGELFPPELGRPAACNTVFSIIMNLTRGTMELCPGHPCSMPYELYSLN